MTAKPNHYVPKEGLVWNPMRKMKRNAQCLCSSGKKFKNCCKDNLPNAVPREQAERALTAMRVAAQHLENKNGR